MTCQYRRYGIHGLARIFLKTAICLSLWLSAGLVAVTNVSAGETSAADIEAGRLLAADRKQGNCYTCHQVEGAELAGDVAPPLVVMSRRYPDRDALRAQIADARIRNPNTVMPPYGAYGILTEQQLDLVVEYVHSL